MDDIQSNNLNETLTTIDECIDVKKKDIELGEALKRLKKNPDYKLVIVDSYIKAETNRLFEILTDPSGDSKSSPEEIQRMIDAINHFKGHVGIDSHIGTIETNALNSPSEILREEIYRKEVTAEYANGEY